MFWRALFVVTLVLLLTGCSQATSPAPKALPPVSVPVVKAEDLDELLPRLQAQALALNYASAKRDAYKPQWAEFLRTAEAALAHPGAWSARPDYLRLVLRIDQPEYRVYSAEWHDIYAQKVLINIWVQWPDEKGITQLQLLRREERKLLPEVKAYGSLLLLLALESNANGQMEAWQLEGAEWRPAAQALAAIGASVGPMAVTRTATALSFAGGYWDVYGPDAIKNTGGPEEEPILCPGLSIARHLCYKLQVTAGQVGLQLPAERQVDGANHPE